MRQDEWQRKRRLTLIGAGDEAALLEGLRSHDGVISAELGGRMLQVAYTLQAISLADIESIIGECGFKLSSAPVARGLRAIHLYCEQIQLEARGYDTGWDSYVRAAYMSRYRSRRHGRIDDRPQQWRRYLERPKSEPSE